MLCCPGGQFFHVPIDIHSMCRCELTQGIHLRHHLPRLYSPNLPICQSIDIRLLEPQRFTKQPNGFGVSCRFSASLLLMSALDLWINALENGLQAEVDVCLLPTKPTTTGAHLEFSEQIRLQRGQCGNLSHRNFISPWLAAPHDKLITFERGRSNQLPGCPGALRLNDPPRSGCIRRNIRIQL
jgi:hypothetical protein